MYGSSIAVCGAKPKGPHLFCGIVHYNIRFLQAEKRNLPKFIIRRLEEIKR